MDSSIRTGYLVLADITGYTAFLATSELPQAQGILREFLGLIMKSLTPALRIAEVEGDAVFAYVPDHLLPRGETLLELVESTYLAFRELRGAKERMSTCGCDACHGIHLLDLKFVIHHGEFIEQEIDGKIKPVGSSVNIVHRLLKNGVTAATGWRGYLLCSEDCLRAMGVEPCDMYACSESYEHLGDIHTRSLDLDTRYRALTDARYRFISPEEAFVTTSRDVPGHASLVWDWLNDPQRRRIWSEGSVWQFVDRPEGRTARGSTNRCSESNLTENVLDWRPFSYFTVGRKRGPITLIETTRLEPLADGTRITWTHQLEGPLPLWLRRRLCTWVVRKGMTIEHNADIIERNLAAAAIEYQDSMAQEPYSM